MKRLATKGSANATCGNGLKRNSLLKPELRAALPGREKTGKLPNQVVNTIRSRFLVHEEVRSGDVWIELVHRSPDCTDPGIKS